jgi:hypothetical protein
MQIKVKKIRQLDIIEKELDSINSGVIALPLEEDFAQIATNFVYHDKNIYLFIQDKELYEDLKFGSSAKFTAIKDSSFDKKSKGENIYRLFYISVNGILKKVEEKKLRDNIKQGFVQKYSGQLIESEGKSKSFSKLVIIDSEELIATEETGT